MIGFVQNVVMITLDGEKAVTNVLHQKMDVEDLIAQEEEEIREEIREEILEDLNEEI